MRVEKLIYGPISGWFKSESGKIMENSMTTYTPKFDRIVLQDFKTKTIKDKPLSLFKTGKYVWLEKQEVLLKKAEEQYQIKFSECVLNELKINEIITDVKGQQYAKYEAIFYAVISYDTIQKAIVDKPTKVEKTTNLVNKTETDKRDDPIVIEEIPQKTGCFSRGISSSEINSHKTYGFFGNRSYKNKREHFNQIFKVNKEFFVSTLKGGSAKFK